MNIKRNFGSFSGLATLACAVVFMFFTIPSLAEQSLQLLNDHVRPEVSSGQAALITRLPSSQQLNLSIVLPLRNQGALDRLLSELSDSSSPNYRQFLNVQQFTDQFGPTADDFQAVVKFAQANGFTVTSIPANRLIVPIRGTSAQIEAAFNVKMNVYQHPTENRIFFSPDQEPSLHLSVPVAHISGLSNFSVPRPLAAKVPVLQSGSGLTNAGSGPGGEYLARDMRAAYYGGTALTGKNQCVGLVEFGGYGIGDVVSSFDGGASYSTNGSNYTLSYTTGGVNYKVPINNVLLDGASVGTYNSDEVEVVLDIVQAIGMAPGVSQIRVYMAPDAWTEASPNYIFPSSTSDATILNQMAVDNACKQLSISWNWKPESVTYLNQFFEVFAAQGQNFFAASGDNGSWPNSAYYFPEEDQYVTAVGGTDLTTNGAGGAWVSETGWSDSGGGHSPDGIGIPSWQSGLNGVNAASTTLRNVPDVAAEGNFDNYTCSLGACAGGWGGTSFAAPRWAGFMALVNQQAVSVGRAPNGGLGFINPTIYSIGEGSNYHSDFHDITSGSNGAYSAGSGYDLVTGWGSPNGQNLINALTAGAPLQTSTPYETNAVVTLFPNSGPPSYITYALTLQDGTAGATIHFQATICNSPYSWDTTSPGETVTFTNDCPSITPYGTMYATAPNYTQSSSISLSF